MAENVDKLYSAENPGSGTFNISKPKRKPSKSRILCLVKNLTGRVAAGSTAGGTRGEATYPWQD